MNVNKLKKNNYNMIEIEFLKYVIQRTQKSACLLLFQTKDTRLKITPKHLVNLWPRRGVG